MKYFISHSKEEIEKVLSLLHINSNRKNKVNLWAAADKGEKYQNIEIGSNFYESIQSEIKNSDGSILFLSKSFFKSNFIINEELPLINEKYKKDPKNYKVLILFVDDLRNFKLYENTWLKNIEGVNSLDTNLNSINSSQSILYLNSLLDLCTPVKSKKYQKFLMPVLFFVLFSILSLFYNSINTNNQVVIENTPLPTTIESETTVTTEKYQKQITR